MKKNLNFNFIVVYVEVILNMYQVQNSFDFFKIMFFKKLF